MKKEPEKDFLLGVNYWPTKQNIKMWKNWEPEEIEKDILSLSQLGTRTLRCFVLDEDFVDTYDNLNQESFSKLEKFLDICAFNGQKVMLTFMVGHMSGRNWLIPWAPANNIYEDKSIVKFTEFVKNIVVRFRDHPAIEGWIMSNEMSIVSQPRDKYEALLIEKAFYGTVKLYDQKHLVSSGEVISYLQEPQNIEGNSDYAGLHIYFYDNDRIRHRFTYGSMLKIYSNDGNNRSFLEEFGYSTNQISEESQGEFIYSMLWSSFINGSLGALIWCSSDFEQIDDPPYEWRLIELNFGLMDRRRNPKISGKMLKKFSEEVKKLEKNGVRSKDFSESSTASILVPFFTSDDYTSIDSNYRNQLFMRFPNGLTISLQLLKMANIESSAFYEDIIREKIESKRLVVIPSVPTLKATSWALIREMSEKNEIGIYASTFRGISGRISLNNFHESFTNLWEEIFGLQNVLEAGEKGIHYSERISLDFLTNFGKIKKGEKIDLTLDGLEVYSYRIKAKDAQVIAQDQFGNPVLTRSNRGKNFFLNVPMELILSSSTENNWNENYHEIYREIGKESGVAGDHESTCPWIEIGRKEDNAAEFLIMINHGPESSSIISTRNSDFMKIGGNAEVKKMNGNNMEVQFPPGGVLVVKGKGGKQNKISSKN
jgi:endo-1,4-beta-mannosidase